MGRRGRWTHLAALVAVASVVAPGPGGGAEAAGSGEPVSALGDVMRGAEAKPAAIQLGNKGGIVKIRWTAWGGQRAQGRGLHLVQTCNPSCAEGVSAYVPTTVELRYIGLCHGRRYYMFLYAGGELARRLNGRTCRWG